LDLGGWGRLGFINYTFGCRLREGHLIGICTCTEAFVKLAGKISQGALWSVEAQRAGKSDNLGKSSNRGLVSLQGKEPTIVLKEGACALGEFIHIKIEVIGKVELHAEGLFTVRVIIDHGFISPFGRSGSIIDPRCAARVSK